MTQIKTKTLNDVCELIVDCEHKTAPIQAIGYPSIRTPNIGKGRLILDNVNRVSEETYKAWTKRAIPQAGDLILAREAPIGNVAIIPNNVKVCLGQRTVLIRANKNKIEPNYLVYLLLGDEIQGKILSVSNGATVHHLNMKDIRNLELPKLPSLYTQRKIAAILSAYDRLIENNTRRIEILEEMARSIYREWFVKFRFPGHEQVQMVDSELGLIPEGWEVVTLESILKLTHGFAFKTEQLSKEKISSYLVVRMGNFKETGGLQVEENIRYIEPHSFKEKYLLKPDDLVMAFSDVTRTGGIIGNVGLIPNDNNHYVLNQRVVKVDFPENLKPFFYIYFNSEVFKNHCLSRADSATVLNLKNEHIYQHQVILSSQKILSCFIENVEPIIRKIQNLGKRNINLRQTRDLLLPRLISGEIDVENLNINTGEIAA